MENNTAITENEATVVHFQVSLNGKAKCSGLKKKMCAHTHILHLTSDANCIQIFMGHLSGRARIRKWSRCYNLVHQRKI